MPITRIRTLISMAYGAAVVLCALLWHAALVPVAAVGAIVVGMAYVALRPEPGVGRNRNRNRNRS